MNAAFDDVVRNALVAHGVPERVRAARGRAVIVLERRARAAGETAWFACHSERQLDAVAGELRSASCVSFYFDHRFSIKTISRMEPTELAGIVESTGDVVIGQLNRSDIHVAMDVLSDPDEVADFVATLDSETLICFGPFPARDDDGMNAITLTLPDGDGVVRKHPH